VTEPTPTVVVRRGRDRFVTRSSGLTSRHAFSFGPHYNHARISFSSLVVCNEDVVGVDAGFDPHPHRNAEIVTWVLSGTLVHADSFGNRGLVYPGLAQRLTAGSGVVHSERNDAYRIEPDRPAEAVHFVQMWIRPDEPDTTPGYAQRELPLADLTASWVPVASGDRGETGVSLGARGCTLWATRLGAGGWRTLPEGPRAFLHVARGFVEVEGTAPLGAGDALEIRGQAALRVSAVVDAELLVWVLASR
jgi:redox-sensitive bicupin YhaK (pirin superfamily)